MSDPRSAPRAGHAAERVVQLAVDAVELVVDRVRRRIAAANRFSFERRHALLRLAPRRRSRRRDAPAVTAAETAAPSAGVCGEPAISIGWPITSA